MKITNLKKCIVRIAENFTKKSKSETSKPETSSEPSTHERRMDQMRKNPNKRVDSDRMTDVEKMDAGFNGKTYSINGIDVDF